MNEWEETYINSTINISLSNDKKLKILTNYLIEKSRNYSLDTSRASPFSLLAKDNDILWNLGGKPDDTVIMVARIHK